MLADTEKVEEEVEVEEVEEEIQKGKTSWHCQFIPETPQKCAECYSPYLHLHTTHTTVNKLPSVWKHVLLWSVYTQDHTASHEHHFGLQCVFTGQSRSRVHRHNASKLWTLFHVMWLMFPFLALTLTDCSPSPNLSCSLPSFPLNLSNLFSSWCQFFFFQDGVIPNFTGFSSSFMLEFYLSCSQPLVCHWRDAVPGRKDG